MKRQRGVALITAILIMALTTTLVFTLEWDNSLDLRRTYVSIYREEAIQAALGAETWVQGILLDDLNNSTTDHLDEIWATEIPGLPLESDSIQGQIFGQIDDLQGRFNINNLIDANGEVDPVSLTQFTRLLNALGIDPRFAGITADWLDSNEVEAIPDGAEDPLYTGKIPPYRAANRLITTTSELAALEGMDKATLDTLRPHIYAVPGRQPINVNTATGPVLQSLGDNISVSDVESLFAERENGGFANIQTSFATIIDPDLQQQGGGSAIVETSEFFQLKVIVQIDTVRITYFSVMNRGPGSVTPVLRSLGTT